MTHKISEAADFAASIRTKPDAVGPGQLVVDPNFEEDPTVAKVVEFAIKRRKNLLLVGPTGCGKSCLAINVMARLHEQAEIFSCDGNTSTEELIGKPWVTTDAKGNGITVAILGAGLRAYKAGKGLLLEEVDMAVPDILSSLHRVMEVNQQFYACNIGAEEVIPKNPNFFVVATANTIGTGEDTFMYAGTKPLNQAFMNRFSLTVQMDYLPPMKESQVLVKKTGISGLIADRLVKVANDVRDAANPKRIKSTSGSATAAPGSASLAATISTRDLLEWSDAIMGMNLSAREAAEYAFLGRISEADADAIRTFIANRIV
jgi:cobaltochelatase CobS